MGNANISKTAYSTDVVFVAGYTLWMSKHCGCSFALPAGFLIISHDIFRNNEIKINFDVEILTFFAILLSPEGFKYNKVLTKSIYLTIPIHDYIINIIVLIKILFKFHFV